MYNEDEMLEEINPDELVLEDLKNETEEDKKEKRGKQRKQNKEQIKKEEEDKFSSEYKKMGGIQHIICSATLSIDPSGRVTPK